MCCYKPPLCLISNGWMDLQGQGAAKAAHANTGAQDKKKNKKNPTLGPGISAIMGSTTEPRNRPIKTTYIVEHGTSQIGILLNSVERGTVLVWEE